MGIQIDVEALWEKWTAAKRERDEALEAAAAYWEAWRDAEARIVELLKEIDDLEDRMSDD
jgi:hypothetical protein